MKFIQPDWPAPAQIKAYTTVRNSWGDRRPHHDTHSGFHTSDANELEQLAKLLQLPSEPIWITQTHSTHVIEALPQMQRQVADASFTHQPNRVCIVLTADCLPILICNQQGTQIAAIHAGWRGLANGIVEATLQTFASSQGELLVWLGPAIGPQKFEVGRDVYDAFVLKHAESDEAFTSHTEGKWLADLYALARIRLHLQGVKQVYGGDYCTYTQDDLFFSYRRDKGKTGRMASLIWISD